MIAVQVAGFIRLMPVTLCVGAMAHTSYVVSHHALSLFSLWLRFC